MSATVAPTTPAPPPLPSSAPPPATSFWQSTALPSVLSVVMALVVGAVLIAVSDDDVRAASSYFFARPGDMLGAVVTSVVEAYGALFRGSVDQRRRARAWRRCSGRWPARCCSPPR